MTDFQDIDPKTLDYDDLIKVGYHIQVQANEIAAKLKDFTEEINRRGKRPGTRVVGNAMTRLTRPNRFSEEVALAKLTKAQQRRISETKLSGPKAKKEFGEDSPIYQSLLVPAEKFTVTIGKASTTHKVKDADQELEDPFEERE